jgi:hypothetical protein
MDQIERLAHETNCWVYIAAQHPNATGDFIHYTSPRLRREGKSEMEKIMTDVHITFSALMSARRKDAIELGKALATAKQAAEAAEANAEVMRRTVEAQQAEIAEYRAKLGL